MPEYDSSLEFRDVHNFPGYKVGSDGSVWSRWKKVGLGPGKGTQSVLGEEWNEVKPMVSWNGRLRVMLCPGRKRVQVHRLVLEHFVGPCPHGMECRHFPDPNPKNCRADNLSWGTKKQNEADKVAHGTKKKGEQVRNAVLKESDVLLIRDTYRGRYGDLTRLGRQFGVSNCTILAAVKGKTWKHLIPSPASEPSQSVPQSRGIAPSPTEPKTSV